jgi:hypothetical protein
MFAIFYLFSNPSSRKQLSSDIFSKLLFVENEGFTITGFDSLKGDGLFISRFLRFFS